MVYVWRYFQPNFAQIELEQFYTIKLVETQFCCVWVNGKWYEPCRAVSSTFKILREITKVVHEGLRNE